MITIDLRKQLKHLYQPSAKQFSIVDVPPLNFLMIDGAGNPNTSQDYQRRAGSAVRLVIHVESSA